MNTGRALDRHFSGEEVQMAREPRKRGKSREGGRGHTPSRRSRWGKSPGFETRLTELPGTQGLRPGLHPREADTQAPRNLRANPQQHHSAPPSADNQSPGDAWMQCGPCPQQALSLRPGAPSPLPCGRAVGTSHQEVRHGRPRVVRAHARGKRRRGEAVETRSSVWWRAWYHVGLFWG